MRSPIIPQFLMPSFECALFRSLAGAVFCVASLPAHAFIFNTGNDVPPAGMTGGLRWDAAPRVINGDDRSLTGGISWAVQGGSFAAFKANFSWSGAAPSDAVFEGLIREAFDFWMSPDINPQLPLAAPFTFVYDPLRSTTADPLTGAEIDFLAEDLGFTGNAGGTLSAPILNDTVKLTSGTTGYPSDVIGGVDIRINNHAGTNYTLAGFRALLTHEIGHALGMGHAGLGLANRFIDDNYDGSSETTANATLTNSFSHLINPLAPSNSPGLHLYTVPDTALGTAASGVHIVMERFLSLQTIQAANPISADDYAQRQFLYPATAPSSSGTISGTTTGLVPLDELGSGIYQGATGGLYPGGSNVIPAAHFTAGQALAQQVQPLDSAGNPSPNGKIGVVMLGMSNSSFIFGAMNELLLGQTASNVVLVQAAQGGYDVGEWADPANVIWTNTLNAVNAKGITPEQVQVVLQYHSMANSKYPPQPWPATPQDVQSFCEQTMRNLPALFPNAKLSLWSSREFAGLATTMNNPEPYAYESGFAVKWMIERQINGDASLNFNPNAGPVKCPWMAWGPYVWGDGITPRADGSLWESRDFNADGVHPSVRGRTKAAAAWAHFLLTDPLTAPWLRASGNRPPMVKIIGPTTNVIVEAGGRVALEAHAEDIDGTVARVDFYQGNILLGSDTTAPYSLLWTGFASGDYTVKAVAFDDTGATTTSQNVTLLLRNATTGNGTVNVATDSFESGDFVGGAGWLSQGWTVVGNATVINTLTPPAGAYQSQLKTGASLTRAVDLSATATPELSFKWRGLLPAGYTFFVESIGTTTQTIFTRTNVSASATLTESIPLTPFNPGANFTLRFRVAGPATAATLLLDDIRITFPAPAAHAPPTLLLRDTAPGKFQLIGTAAIHRTYTLEFSPDLKTWTPLHHTTAIADGSYLLPASVSGTAGFFRSTTVQP